MFFRTGKNKLIMWLFFIKISISYAENIPFFLTQDEITSTRNGIVRNDINVTTSSNKLDLLINGDNVFKSLYNDIKATEAGDFIWLTGWSINKDVMLLPDPNNLKQSKQSGIQSMLIDAIRRNVEVRILINQNIVYSPILAIEFCGPLNQEAGKVVCAPDSRHNAISGNMHQKAIVVKRNNETVAYVGSMDISAGRYDSKEHNQDAKYNIEPKNSRSYRGWTGGMLYIKGPAVLDVARHLYHEITDPVAPFTLYKMADTVWKNPPIVKYNTDTILQILLTAAPLGGIKYGYYSNWAPRGEASILADTIKAIQNAKQYVFISDQFLWYPPIIEAVIKQLPKIQAAIFVTNADNAFDQPIGSFNITTVSDTRNYYRYNIWKNLQGIDKVSAYKIIKEGLPDTDIRSTIYTHWKVLIVDDIYAIIGSAGVEQAGMNNDIDMSIGVYDREQVTDMRIKLWSEYLNFPYPNDDPNMKDPVTAIKTLWTQRSCEKW